MNFNLDSKKCFWVDISLLANLNVIPHWKYNFFAHVIGPIKTWNEFVLCSLVFGINLQTHKIIKDASNIDYDLNVISQNCTLQHCTKWIYF